jgi:hypothetical protein
MKEFYGKNGFKWTTEEFVSKSRIPKHNVIQLPGLWPPARIGTQAQPLQVWNLLVTDEMLHDSVQWTTVKIGKVNYND